MRLKRCYRCKTDRIISDFSKDKNRKDNLSPQCRPCTSRQGAIWRKRTKAKSHGLYGIYTAMKQRCLNPKCDVYSLYGGRGISICEDWTASRDEFISWAKKAGHRPGLWLDRIDNDGDYSPRNCRFVSPEISAHNRRGNLTPGEVLKIRSLFNLGRARNSIAKKFGVSYVTVYKVTTFQTAKEI